MTDLYDYHNGPNLGLEPTTPGQGIDPATLPGLTAAQRCALGRFAKPAGGPAGDAQPVAAQETYPQMMPAELSQFLSDVMTAAGLVSHGKQCKALGERLGDACMRLRLHCQELFAAPVAAQQADDARDAERYRWLRKGESDDVAVVRGLGAMDYGMSAVVSTYSEEIDGDDLDAAIDAARQGEGGAE